MLLTLSQLLALAAKCAPTVAPLTLLSIVQVESGYDPLAIAVNTGPRPTVQAATVSDAAARATALIAAGHSVDLGLGQINSSNLKWLELTPEQAFDPCQNLAAAARVLRAGFKRSPELDPQSALRVALSYYNTGDRSRGFRNGYVAKVERAAAAIMPAGPAPQTPPDPSISRPHPAETSRSWDVFGDIAASTSFVINLAPQAPAIPPPGGVE